MSSSRIPANEPVCAYAPGTPERAALKRTLVEATSTTADVALVIDGVHVRTEEKSDLRMPHNHRHVLGRVSLGSPDHIQQAISAAMNARHAWAALSQDARAAVFLRAADLLAGPYRDRANAATMLGQSKTAHQSEIDAVCELADFWRFNPYFAEHLIWEQPLSPAGQSNRMELRPLDGFVYAITPFNFTSIAGNLPTAPALLGNTVVWKPAQSQALSAMLIMEILEAAGLPPGVINLVFGRARMISDIVLASPQLGGIHFTGSTEVFGELWSRVGQNIAKYAQYPRLVGETGGKDFVFAHPSADVDALVTAIVRGGFEYQGQKCSAASRVYLPRTLARVVRERLVAAISDIRIGDVADFRNFMGAVIDEPAFDRIRTYLEFARASNDARVLVGGAANKERGWFVEPTLVETDDPRHRLMVEEIFGPVVTMWTYDDARIDEALSLCDSATPYALTGAIFAGDRQVIAKLEARLAGAAGNFYINDKPTGAVVGQQPFGGSRASGTNDKAGSPFNLVRWVSPRSVKENFVPPTRWSYPFMTEA